MIEAKNLRNGFRLTLPIVSAELEIPRSTLIDWEKPDKELNVYLWKMYKHWLISMMYTAFIKEIESELADNTIERESTIQLEKKDGIIVEWYFSRDTMTKYAYRDILKASFVRQYKKVQDELTSITVDDFLNEIHASNIEVDNVLEFRKVNRYGTKV